MARVIKEYDRAGEDFTGVFKRSEWSRNRVLSLYSTEIKRLRGASTCSMISLYFSKMEMR